MEIPEKQFEVIAEDEANDLNILHLPEEILVHILSFLNGRSRRSSALVCQQFYDSICELEKYKTPITLTTNDISDNKIYKSIINSQRKFNDLRMLISYCENCPIFNRVQTITERFGQRLKKFALEFSNVGLFVSETELFRVLVSMPNVEDFLLDGVKVIKGPRSILNKQLNVTKLKKLKISNCNFQTQFFKCFPPNVISKLELSGNNFVNLESCVQNFLNNQSKITKLCLIGSDITNQMIDVKFELNHLHLEELELYTEVNELNEILQHQPNIRSIFIDNPNNKIFATIRSLKNLEVLKLRLHKDEQYKDALKYISDLINLRELKIFADEWSEDDLEIPFTWCTKKLLKLEKLEISSLGTEITEDVIKQIASCFPNLRQFKAKCTSSDIVEPIFEAFPDLVTFEINCGDDCEDESTGGSLEF